MGFISAKLGIPMGERKSQKGKAAIARKDLWEAYEEYKENGRINAARFSHLGRGNTAKKLLLGGRRRIRKDWVN